MYKTVLVYLGFKECRLVVGVFVLFHTEGPRLNFLRAAAAVHVDDTRMIGD